MQWLCMDPSQALAKKPSVFFLQQDPVSDADKFPSAEASHSHPKDNVIEMIEETLLDPPVVHYNICQV